MLRGIRPSLSPAEDRVAEKVLAEHARLQQVASGRAVPVLTPAPIRTVAPLPAAPVPATPDPEKVAFSAS